jgi:hypothetical protein
MDHLDPIQGAERWQASQRVIPQECHCGCHLSDEDDLPLAQHDEPCCETCVCGLHFLQGLEEHQRRCEAYLIHHYQG